jgi:uncharacterized protein
MSKIDKDTTVTVVVSRRIKKGREKEFEELSPKLTQNAHSFDGYLGSVLLKPSSSDDPEYRIIYKFNNQDNLDVWLASSQRLELLKQIEDLLEEESKISTSVGIVTWLSLPGKPAVKAPKKYKITLVSWLALYPTVTLIFLIFGSLLSEVPLLVRTFIVTAMVMPLMSYVLMPRFTKWFSFWLFADDKKSVR